MDATEYKLAGSSACCICRTCSRSHSLLISVGTMKGQSSKDSSRPPPIPTTVFTTEAQLAIISDKLDTVNAGNKEIKTKLDIIMARGSNPRLFK